MKNNTVPLLFLILALLGSCYDQRESLHLKTAKAIMEPVDNSGVKGFVIFSEDERGVKIVGEFSGLTPGEHGLHIHEFGDCGGPGAENAGGHFNPYKDPHGGPHDSPGHVGDLGNVRANDRGRAHFEKIDFVISLEGKNSILGKSIVIKKYRDDFRSQPYGNAGPGVACGIIISMDEESKEEFDD